MVTPASFRRERARGWGTDRSASSKLAHHAKKGFRARAKVGGSGCRKSPTWIGDSANRLWFFRIGSPIPFASSVPGRPMGSRPIDARSTPDSAGHIPVDTHAHTSGCASFLHPARVFSLDAPNAVRRARARGSESSGTVGRGDRPGWGRSRATPQTSIRLHAPSRASTRPSHVTSHPPRPRPPAPRPPPVPPVPPRHPRAIHPHRAFPSSQHLSSIPGRSPSPSRAIRFDPILR